MNHRTSRLALMVVLGCSMLVGCSSIPGFKRSFDVTKFGAAGDGATDNSSAFAQAIDACKQAGGGVVRVPAGRYLTGPMDLVSNMTLHLDKDAVILFIDDQSRYPTVETRWEGVMREGRRPLLWAKDCSNVAITGSGTIDGQGAKWWFPIQEIRRRRQVGPSATTTSFAAATMPTQSYATDATRRRPPLAQFRDCSNVRIEGITFQNSPFWTLHTLFTDNLVIRNCTFLAPEDGPNTDAVDIDSCRKVLIERCYADVGDDGFTLKSGRDEDGRRVGRPTEDVVVRNCTVKHAHGGVVIGSETAGSVRRIRFSNCTFEGTDNGVRIKTMRGRGGIIEDVVAENIKMKDVVNAFIITMRYQRSNPEPVSERTPRIRDVHLKNITASDSRRAGIIDGLEEMPITDITFQNLDLTAQEGISVSDAEGIEFRNVKIATDAPLPALKQNRAQGVKVENWQESQRTPATTRP